MRIQSNLLLHDAILRIQCTCIIAVQQLLYMYLVREKILLSQQTQEIH